MYVADSLYQAGCEVNQNTPRVIFLLLRMLLSQRRDLSIATEQSLCGGLLAPAGAIH
jgi:hypothetical protein